MRTVAGRWVPFLGWPLRPYRETVDLTEPNGGLGKHVHHARYSLRLQRYWWAAQKLAEESASREGREERFVVVDLGCEQGWLKRFTPVRAGMEWIGLDGETGHASLVASGYDRVEVANFDERLPLPDGCADAVVSLHVFEHLPRPAFTVSEVARVLKPGGVFLAGAPTSPGPVAWVRTRWLRWRDRAGRNRHWGHLQKLSPGAWQDLCEGAGLRTEFVTGSHLIRRTGWRLEDARWWVRLNQLWAGVFPSLGSEAYVAARRVTTAGSGSRVSLSERLGRWWLRTDWAMPVAAAVLAVATLGAVLRTEAVGTLRDDIARHQDGNDAFVWCAFGAEEHAPFADPLGALSHLEGLADLFAQYAAEAQDLHVIVPADHIGQYLVSALGEEIRVADEWLEGGKRFYVLSLEAHEPRLREYLEPVESHTPPGVL